MSTLFDADCDGYLAHADCDPDDPDYNVDFLGKIVVVVVGTTNTPPTINLVSISPSIVYTDTTITATASSSDVDGDNVTLTYSWSVDGSVVQTGSADTLDGSIHFDKDQSVSVSVTPNDGTEDGTPVSSNAVSVSNSVPSTPVVSVSPSAPNAGQDDLVCSATSTDADGDSLTYTYSWEDGQGAVVSNTNTVTGSSTAAGDYTCYVSVDDGSGAGGSTSASITVASSSADTDGDGFDAESSGGTDCDDNDPTVNPNATEVPDDGIDNDFDDVQLTSVRSTLSAGDLRVSEMQINFKPKF